MLIDIYANRVRARSNHYILDLGDIRRLIPKPYYDK